MKTFLAVPVLLAFALVPSASAQLESHHISTDDAARTATGVFNTTTTFTHPFTYNVNNFDFTTEYQFFNGIYGLNQALVSGLFIPNTSTAEEGDAIAGYVDNQSVSHAGTAFFGIARCAAPGNGARCWGGAFVAGDSIGGGNPAPYSSFLTGLELDLVPENPGDSPVGVEASIGSTSQTTFTGDAAFAATHHQALVKWGQGFQTQDAAAVVFSDAGAGCTTGTCNSQATQFNYYASNVRKTSSLQVDSNGNLSYTGGNYDPFSVQGLLSGSTQAQIQALGHNGSYASGYRFGYDNATMAAELEMDGSGNICIWYAASGTLTNTGTCFPAGGGFQTSNFQLAGGTAMTGNQGNGTKVQHSTGSVTNGNLASFDANGNAVDSTINAASTVSAVQGCGTTTTCSKTGFTSPRIVIGTVALTAGAATVASMTAWTSTSSFVCVGTDQTSAAAVKIVNASTTSITITGTGTDVIAYQCVGN